MKIVPLGNETLELFRSYCRKYRGNVDESYLHDEDLVNFKMNADNPTYILIDDNGQICGTTSLIMDSYYRSGKRGRFRIFHLENGTVDIYEQLFQEILKHTSGIEHLFIHVPEQSKDIAEMVKSLGFAVERHSFGMIREDMVNRETSFPEGFELRTFMAGRDEKDWCDVRNVSFMKLAGSDIPKTPDMVKFEEEDGYIEGGTKLLYYHDSPVGSITISTDVEEGETIAYLSAICVRPEHQGKGLGRNLVRAGIAFGKARGLTKTMLSVNAENEKALELYEKEGFRKNYMSTCYQYKIKRD